MAMRNDQCDQYDGHRLCPTCAGDGVDPRHANRICGLCSGHGNITCDACVDEPDQDDWREP